MDEIEFRGSLSMLLSNLDKLSNQADGIIRILLEEAGEKIQDALDEIHKGSKPVEKGDK